jgi:hypothetical protein
MTKQQFQMVLALAQDTEVSLRDADVQYLIGYALPDFKPVVSTLRPLAAMLRWQAQCLNGSWDETAIQECYEFWVRRRRVELLDVEAGQADLTMQAFVRL